jgi:hypothetical protein
MQKGTFSRQTLLTSFATGAALALASTPALAGGSGMPWEGPLQQIVDSFTGPVAQAGGVLASPSLKVAPVCDVASRSCLGWRSPLQPRAFSWASLVLAVVQPSAEIMI